MSSGVFKRSTDVVRTRSEVFSDSPPCHDVAGKVAHLSTIASDASSAEVRPQLAAIRRELDVLKQRRAALEAQRSALLNEKLHPSRDKKSDGYNTSSPISTPRGLHASWSAGGLTGTRRHCEEGTFAAASTSHSTSRHRYVDSTVLANMSEIPSERRRQRHLTQTPELGVKVAMREAAKHDSTLLMGDFLPEDNPHACTFGRERRFRSVVGQHGQYYLSTDVGVEQLLNRDHVDPVMYQRVAPRHDQTPGPGAYTPRYCKVSRPPRFY
ncbi:hypothetical protein ABB37_03565 [Leptomonas pyrrhocoris]|uniref:Uncharacterized protein n=1 Tax=Leptomonas pyrrhocoris TaxID=157538 RepID=A0A0M9G574_LEPPY|nr:hypothetical protein ABB37_03565 [Leptomonas pyrrhocoris]KPA82513.1 hypothetical protein ABB37_03565 [Leptomonas pyrrhocoris]|eukprot:XP_015660952.1 hypothetical protein ABB37_03565 [Leptomonas pyrrhocoris]